MRLARLASNSYLDLISQQDSFIHPTNILDFSAGGRACYILSGFFMLLFIVGGGSKRIKRAGLGIFFMFVARIIKKGMHIYHIMYQAKIV